MTQKQTPGNVMRWRTPIALAVLTAVPPGAVAYHRHLANQLEASGRSLLATAKRCAVGNLVSPDQHPDSEMAAFTQRWKEYRDNGGEMWEASTWMKSPTTYAGMSTTDLAIDVFQKPLFAVEMSAYDDPKFGYARMMVMHDGVSELMRREDAWRGIVEVFSQKSAMISPESTYSQIFNASFSLVQLVDLFGIEQARSVTVGHDRRYLAALADVLDQYIAYFDTTRGFLSDERHPFGAMLPQRIASLAAAMLCRSHVEAIVGYDGDADRLRSLLSQRLSADELRFVLSEVSRIARQATQTAGSKVR